MYTESKKGNSVKKSICSNTFRFLMGIHICWNVDLKFLWELWILAIKDKVGN